MMNLQNSMLVVIAAIFLQTSCNNISSSTNQQNKKETKKVVSIPSFNADSAYYFVQKQVSFGPRVPGTEAHSKCASWLSKKLKTYCDTVIDQKFKARTYDKVTRNGINIIGSFKPEEQKRILLMAHWDSRPYADHDENESNHKTPIDGANDGASGVGTLIEMARLFEQQSPSVGIDIIFFDLEDWGPPTQMNIYKDEYWGLGSQYWSNQPHVYGYNASFGILLDMIGAENPSFRKEYFSMLYARYITDLVWETADDIGYGDYFLDEEGPAINDDHVYVNRIAKIPSIDIIDLNAKSAESSFFEHWHTVNDNMDYISKESLEIVANVVLTVVYNE